MNVELDAWMTWLEARHLANLQFSEVSRALRALSSAYVERRGTAIPQGRVLDTAGKRAAFALYYGPLHFVAVRQVIQNLGVCARSVGATRTVIDLGCGTGAVGASVGTRLGARRVQGFDVHPWAVGEARATYARFGLDAAVTRRSVARFRAPNQPAFIVAGYVANELPETDRAPLLLALLAAVRHGAEILIIEPLSGRAAPWWPSWAAAFAAAGGRVDAWSLELDPPVLTRQLGLAAGLTPTRAKVRTIYAGPAT